MIDSNNIILIKNQNINITYENLFS